MYHGERAVGALVYKSSKCAHSSRSHSHARGPTPTADCRQVVEAYHDCRGVFLLRAKSFPVRLVSRAGGRMPKSQLLSLACSDALLSVIAYRLPT